MSTGSHTPLLPLTLVLPFLLSPSFLFAVSLSIFPTTFSHYYSPFCVQFSYFLHFTVSLSISEAHAPSSLPLCVNVCVYPSLFVILFSLSLSHTDSLSPSLSILFPSNLAIFIVYSTFSLIIFLFILLCLYLSVCSILYLHYLDSQKFLFFFAFTFERFISVHLKSLIVQFWVIK